MATDVAVRNVPPFIRWTMIVTAIALGAGYLFGPDQFSSAPGLVYAKSLMPIQAWGAVFMLAGMLMIPTRLTGHSLAVVAWGTWGASIWVAYFHGLGTAWGGFVWPVTFVAFNGYEVFRWGQKRVERLRARPWRRAPSSGTR